MFKMRSEQIDAFDKASASLFHRRLMSFLRLEMPEATTAMSDNDLLKYIVDKERRAEQYNITSDAGIAQFVCLSFAISEDFDELPEVKAYLQGDDLDPEEKLDELVNYLDALGDDPEARPEDTLLEPEE